MKKSILFGLMLVLMLTHPVWVTEGARCGLLLWYRAVVPALFPFLVLSTLIVAEGSIGLLVRPLGWLLHPLFSLSSVLSSPSASVEASSALSSLEPSG